MQDMCQATHPPYSDMPDIVRRVGLNTQIQLLSWDFVPCV
jgi:hypothetical protein